MTYWQIAAGDGTVDLVDIFLKLNVALIGPGNEGDYFDNKATYDNMGRDGDLVRAFAQDVQIGDILILKHLENPHTKTWNVIAVGRVVGPYRYEPLFDKVDCYKWDVQHCRRVIWTQPDSKVIVKGGGAPIRIQRVNETNPLKEAANKILNA